jgi:hypothetical protein
MERGFKHAFEHAFTVGGGNFSAATEKRLKMRPKMQAHARSDPQWLLTPWFATVSYAVLLELGRASNHAIFIDGALGRHRCGALLWLVALHFEISIYD